MAQTNALNNTSSPFDVDNIHLETNTISSTNSNGNVVIDPDGTGNAEIASGDVNLLEGIVVIDSGTTADSYLQYNESTTGKWRTGNDETDDSYRIAIGSALGTSDAITISSSGEVNVPLQSRFRAEFTTPALNVTGDGTSYTMVLDDVDFNVGSDYDNTSGIYTCPSDGFYVLTAVCFVLDLTAQEGFVGIYADGSLVFKGIEADIGAAQNASAEFYLPVTANLYFDAGTEITFRTTVSRGAKTVDIDGHASVGLLH